MLKKYFAISLLLSLVITVKAQETKAYDSLLTVYQSAKHDTVKVRLLNNMYWEVAYSDIELSKTYAEKLIEIAKKNNLKESLGRGYNNLAGYYEIKNVNDSAKYHLKKAKAIFEELKDTAFIVRIDRSYALLDYTEGKLEDAIEKIKKNIELRTQIKDSIGLAIDYNFMGGMYQDLGQLEIANEYVYKALKLYELLNDDVGKADTLNTLSVLVLFDEDYEKALEYGLEARAIYIKNNDLFYQAFTDFHIGQNYYYLENYKQSEKYLLEGYDLATKLNSDRILAATSAQLGNTYHKMKSYEKSEKYLKESMTYADPVNNKFHYIGLLNSLADVYNIKEEPNKALTLMNEAIVLLDTVNGMDLKQMAHNNRYKSYQKLGNYKKALEDYTIHKQLEDSLYRSEQSKRIEEMRTKYETEKKEQEIKNQKNEIDLLTIKNNNTNLQRLLLAFGLVFALIAVYAFFQRSKKHRLLKEKAEADLEFKTKELTTHALHLAKKNEVLNDLKQKAKVLKADADADPGYQMLIQTINFDLQDDNNWENFSKYFEQVHKGFNEKAQQQFPNITSNDLRLMALLKMNLSSKEIANILNISSDGIKKARQRLRKKMGLDSNDSLEITVISI